MHVGPHECCLDDSVKRRFYIWKVICFNLQAYKPKKLYFFFTVNRVHEINAFILISKINRKKSIIKLKYFFKWSILRLKLNK